MIDVGVFALDTGNRSLWWVDGVAVATDGVNLLADLDGACADDWLFAVGRPDLVIADRGFAAAAVGAGLETIAFADVDAVILGVAARRDRPVRVIPVDEQRPPGAYKPLIEALTAGLLEESAAESWPDGREGAAERPGGQSAVEGPAEAPGEGSDRTPGPEATLDNSRPGGLRSPRERGEG